ncbi:hypothetical protein Psta_1987 [Pirellula staleyi DSM 6068]|uniref:Uncharacterized protein n=1 Tax=Pirellula staleyi (strain ATCC 27377 / DSM 6068 / ICPB 4128) TaxID=530564 RepID=D2R0R3_PIRSD|nr:hypothetical protein Psta_1987 [Pirellula staleyi DSM 6068]
MHAAPLTLVEEIEKMSQQIIPEGIGSRPKTKAMQRENAALLLIYTHRRQVLRS